MARPAQTVTLIGFGAIGKSVLQRTAHMHGVRITHVVVSAAKVAETQSAVNAMFGEAGDAAHAGWHAGPTVVSAVPDDATLVLECAGHTALTQHVLPALARGVECGILSVGALSEAGMVEKLTDAARSGDTQLHLLAGAIGAIDAIAAARSAGLEEVLYTGRKPPAGWRGSPAEQVVDLDALTVPTVILQATAREAARLYPKNANVAATVSLAGLGLDATQVQLIADPTVTENIHEVRARGAFGELHLTMRGKPLADNPKTSALTVLSAVRFLHNRCAPVTL